MKRTVQKLSLLCLTAGLFAEVASAQTSVNIDNPGFELPNTGKIKSGWDVPGSDVPGWRDAGTGNLDSGIENPGGGYYSGNCGAYSMGGDPGAYQITTNTLAFGQQYTLTWYAKEVWGGSVQRVSLLRASSPTDSIASCTEIQVASLPFADYAWAQYTLVYNAGTADVGKYIGVRFSNAGPTGSCWINWDDFSMTVQAGDVMPHITVHPVGQSVYEGDSVTFTAAATGPDLSYQWKAGAPGSGSYTNVPGATTTTLTIPYARASVDYVLYVSNSAGSDTSLPASFFVTPATYVNGLFNGDFELPANGKINAGFDVPGNNVPGWKNAGPNQNDTGIEGSGSGHGGSYAAYIHRGQSGAYQVTPTVITNSGQTISLSWYVRDSWQGLIAKVSLLGAASQETPFDSITVLAGQTNEVTGWWAQNTITYVTVAADVGKFIGVAFQSADPATANGWANFDDFSLDVKAPGAPPTIITQPGSQTAYLTGTTTFTVVPNGSGLSFQWKSGAVGSGVYSNISNGGQFSGANTASLTISNITAANGLDYVVTISNTGGSITSDPATLTVSPDAPFITTQPVASTTRLTTESATFTVADTGGVSYQWKAGAVGSGVYTNLSNGGQFSGVTSRTLTIGNLQKANQADYVVEVSNGGGSVTSAPATLTILNAIYIQTFETSSTDFTALGWVADHSNGQNPLGVPGWGGKGVWAAGATGVPQAFYTTTFLNDGSIPGQMAFPVIKLANVSDMTFYVDVQSWWNPASEHAYFAVQMNWGAWYVASAELATATGNQETRTMAFDPASSSWNQLTVTGTGAINDATMTIIGAPATSNLTGYITGAGLVTLHDSSSWIMMDNFKISGNGFTVLPGLSLAPSGSNAVLTWSYGTLVESTSLAGPWTAVSGSSPKTVTPSAGSHFYRLQLP